jgi:hypothetical protein
MTNTAANSRNAAITALLLSLPFLLINAVVATRAEPVYGWLRGLETLTFGNYGLGFFLLVALLLLWPVGAFVAVRPLFRERRWRIVNLALGAVLLVGFAYVGFALGEEIYRCDVLSIPNCD